MPTSKRKQSRENVVRSKFRKDKGCLYSKPNGNRDESYVYDSRGGIWHVEFYGTSSTSFIDFENKLKTGKVEEKKSNNFKECKPDDVTYVNDSSGQKEISLEEKGELNEDSGSEEDAEEICSVRKKKTKKLVRECEDISDEEGNITKTGRNSRNKFLFVDEGEKSIDKNCTEDKSNLNNSHDHGRPEGAVFSRKVRKEKKQSTESCDLSSQDDEEVIRPMQRRIKKRIVESDSSECEDDTEKESSDSDDGEEEIIDGSEKGSIDNDDDDLSSEDDEVIRPMQRGIKKRLVESDSSEYEDDTEKESTDSNDGEEESIDDDSEEKEAAEETYDSSVRFSSNSETEELSRMQRKMRVSQFFDDEAEEGEETDDFVEEEEEEEEEETDNTSTDDYNSDETFGAEQFIEREAKEDVPSARKRRKKYVIDSEEEEQQQEGECETESVSTKATPENLEKSVNLMNKLTKIMFAGQLKSSLLDIKANEKDMEDTEKENNVDSKLEQVNTKDCIDNQRKKNSLISKYKRRSKLVDRDCVSEPE